MGPFRNIYTKLFFFFALNTKKKKKPEKSNEKVSKTISAIDGLIRNIIVSYNIVLLNLSTYIISIILSRYSSLYSLKY